MGCECQLALKCLFTPTFRRTILTRKVGQTDLVFGLQSGFISRSEALSMQDLQSRCAAAMICASLDNSQTHRQHFEQFI